MKSPFASSAVALVLAVGFSCGAAAQSNAVAAIPRLVATTQSRVIIMDISGVAVVDTAVANHLIKITKATKLMGCECTISGVSASIAQTVVELGIEVGNVKTMGTLKDALADAFRVTGVEIRSAP